MLACPRAYPSPGGSVARTSREIPLQCRCGWRPWRITSYVSLVANIMTDDESCLQPIQTIRHQANVCSQLRSKVPQMASTDSEHTQSAPVERSRIAVSLSRLHRVTHTDCNGGCR